MKRKKKKGKPSFPPPHTHGPAQLRGCFLFFPQRKKKQKVNRFPLPLFMESRQTSQQFRGMRTFPRELRIRHKVGRDSMETACFSSQTPFRSRSCPPRHPPTHPKGSVEKEERKEPHFTLHRECREKRSSLSRDRCVTNVVLSPESLVISSLAVPDAHDNIKSFPFLRGEVKTKKKEMPIFWIGHPPLFNHPLSFSFETRIRIGSPGSVSHCARTSAHFCPQDIFFSCQPLSCVMATITKICTGPTSTHVHTCASMESSRGAINPPACLGPRPAYMVKANFCLL